MRPTDRALMLVAALLSIAVAAVHVDDQGGITAFTDPDWMGWAYRLLEIVAVLTAIWLAYSAGAVTTGVRAGLTWLVTFGVGAGPLIGFVLTRSTGLPGDSDDIGNWGETLGVVSMVVEGALVLIAVVALAGVVRSRPAGTPARRDRSLVAA